MLPALFEADYCLSGIQNTRANKPAFLSCFAATGINPLDHYLAFGLYEERNAYALADYIA